jgi:hypothetical protein
VKTQPVAVLQLSVVQRLLSLQTRAGCVHAFVVQPSVVQASLSLHDAGTVAVCVHAFAVHPSVVQMSLSLHDTGTVGVCAQKPVVQASVVQILLSSQSAATVQIQRPVAVSHTPTEQTTAVKTHPVAVLHVSVVQMSLSLQTIGVLTQAPVAVLHESVVQTLLSLQRVAASKHGGIPIMLKLALNVRNGPSTMP